MNFFICIIFLLNCSPKEKRPLPGGEIRIAWTGGLIGFDPSKDWGCAGAMKLIKLLFSPLYDPDNPGLGIAERFSCSKNDKEWIFYLKRFCYFHNDPCFQENFRKINAYDIKYSYDKASNSWSQLAPLDNIKETIVLDSFTLKIILKEPDKDFLYKLGEGYLYIIPFEAVEKYKDNFSFHPVGSGPFCFQSWNEKEVILIKNKYFWARDKWGQQLPYLEKIRILFFADANQCVTSLLNGTIDLSSSIGDAAMDLFTKAEGEIVLKREYAQRIKVIHSPFPSLTILLMNNRDNPIFDNKNLMIALNYGINREELSNLLFMPRVRFATGPTLRNISNLKYEYNLNKARDYLKRAGYPEGLRNLVFQYYPSPFARELVMVLQKQLEALGIKTKLSCASRPAVLRGEPKWDLGIVSIMYADSTPSSQLGIYSSENAPWVPFHSSIFDSLWKLYKSRDNPDSNLLVRLESLVFEDPPFVYLYWSYPAFLADKRLNNLDPLFLISCYTWWNNE